MAFLVGSEVQAAGNTGQEAQNTMQIKTSPQITVVYLSGVIHRENADEVTRAFEKALACGGKVVLFSFQNVKALLSDGIRLMIALCDRARAAGKEFYITDLPKEVKYTLQITNLLNMLGYAGNTLTFFGEKNIDEAEMRPLEEEAPEPPESSYEKAAMLAHDAPTADLGPVVREIGRDGAISRIKDIGNIDNPDRGQVQPEGSSPASTRRLKRLNEHDLWYFIKNYLPGRIEVRVIDCFLHSKKDVLGLADIVKHLREEQDVVKTALKRLIKRRTLVALGGGLFNYSPTEEVRMSADAVLRLLQNRDTHSKVLKLLLEAEKHS